MDYCFEDIQPPEIQEQTINCTNEAYRNSSHVEQRHPSLTSKGTSHLHPLKLSRPHKPTSRMARRTQSTSGGGGGSSSSSHRSSAADRVAMVIIPAAFSVASQYQKVANYCRTSGSDVMVVQNPSTGGPVRGHIPTMYDDAANARYHIEALVRRGKEVMVVGHAYGGMVAIQACQGLGREELIASGASGSGGRHHRGGVTRLVLVAGVVGVEGQTFIEAMGGFSGPGAPDGVSEAGYGWMSPERAAVCYYSSVSPGEAARHAAGNVPQSAQSLMDPLTFAGYRYIPVTYMVLDDDAMVPSVLQEQYVSVIEATSGQIVDVVHYPADHFPWLTRPEAVIDCLRRAAGEEYFESCNWQ